VNGPTPDQTELRESEDGHGGFLDLADATTPHPSVIGPFQIVGLLGGGSMATLYVANRRGRYGTIQRAVIKRVNKTRPDAELLQQMLLDEARAMAFFEHPNLVTLLDVDEDENGPYLALEYVDGTDLKRVNSRLRTRREALPFELACFMVAEVLRGLHHAHRATDSEGHPLEIVHRDVNPSNVLISRSGHVKLTDFGVVRMRDRVQSKTEPGLVKGKYAYLAPEYIAGNPCSVRTDIYAAGVMLFELLTGRECFTGKSAYEVMWKIVNKGVPMHRLDREEVPGDLKRIVERATSMEPEDRYATAQDMANALEAWMVRNRRHATPWVLSVFFDRHGLLPGPDASPPPMVPLANLQDALPRAPATATEPTPQPELPEEIDLREVRSASSDTEAPSDPTRTEPPPSEANSTSGSEERRGPRGFTVSTSQESEDQSPWWEPTPVPDQKPSPLEMREEVGFGEPTPLPNLDELPPDERLPHVAIADDGHPEPVEPPRRTAAETPRAQRPVARGQGPIDPANPPARGKLEEHAAVDVLAAYADGGHSGILEFRCGLIWKRVRLDRGVPTGITSNMGLELIGEHLVKARIITRDQLDRALEESDSSARSLTQTLLHRGALDRERLEIELGKNLSARLREVLQWRWGTFEYLDRPVPAADILPRLDLDELLGEARVKQAPDHAGRREHESSDDNLNPHRRLREALQVAKSIASGSGKGRVERPWNSDRDPSDPT
jgi:serine/threonine-protein kinase